MFQQMNKLFIVFMLAFMLFGVTVVPLSISADDGGPTAPSTTGTPSTPTPATPAPTPKLPDEITTVNASISSLNIAPYSISLSNTKVSLPSAAGFTFSFDYTLTQDAAASTRVGTDAHQLVVEIIDGSSHKYEQIYELNPVLDPSIIPSPPALSLGSSSLSFMPTIANITNGINFINSITTSPNYTLKIYDQFKGFRRLLATTTGAWFS